MTYKMKLNCLISTLFIAFMLFFQSANAQYNFTKVDEWLNNNVGSLGGRAVMMIYTKGKVVYSRSVNEMSRRQQMVGKVIARRQGKDAGEVLQDLKEDTRINIASCSKWLSAALVMTFVDEGKLKVTDTIGTFLPVMSAHGKGQISIAQCLAHLTGIKPGGLKEDIREISRAQSMDEVINQIAAYPMEAAPGTAFHYSSIGLQLAAAVIEKIAGMDFETLFAERIAKPCGMIHTDFGRKKVPLAAGGARSTAKDYLQFTTMLLQNGQYGGKTVLTGKSIVLMQQNHAAGKKVMGSPAEAGKWGYGFGEWVMDDVSGQQRSDAVCSPGLFGSFPFVDNKLQYTAVLFTMNINNKGRNASYKALKNLTDEIIKND